MRRLEQLALFGRIGGGRFEHLAHFVEQVVEVAELFVDAGEADIGDLVEGFEPIGDGAADLDRLDLALVFAEHFLLDLFDELLQRFGADRPLVAGALQSAENPLAVPRHAAAVALDHRQAGVALDVLVGGETPLALEALAAATDHLARLRRAGVDHLILIFATEGAAHAVSIEGQALGGKGPGAGQGKKPDGLAAAQALAPGRILPYALAMSIRIAMLGDIVGRPGRLAVAQQIPVIRQRWKPDLILANAENAANGTGLAPEHYQKLRDAGVDGLTLGDHAFKKIQIVPILEAQGDVIRPANFPPGAKGKGWMRLAFPPESAAAGRGLFVVTVMGRIFMSPPVDDPFATVERALRELPEKEPIVLLEIHAEATSEKQAIGWQFNGRVAAVVGTHTHVPTADERVLSHGTAYITDIGMCGAQESILGRDIDRVLGYMLTVMPAPFDVAEGDPRVCGVLIEIDEKTRRATAIERLELKADPQAPPFTAS